LKLCDNGDVIAIDHDELASVIELENASKRDHFLYPQLPQIILVAQFPFNNNKQSKAVMQIKQKRRGSEPRL
jgi:hypothetical protein